MNALQFQTARLEAMQRARLAIGTHKEAMMPQGAQNGPNNEQIIPDQAGGLGANPAGSGDVPPGNIRQAPY
jgi:hypothetical protein